MPRPTFHKLKKEKKERVINALLAEFTYHNFDDASITAVVKVLGIAKGSMYQYFEDKKDIFFFLIEHCGNIKKEFIKDLDRDDYPDFWSYLRAVYDHGFDMLAQYPLESAFLHLLMQNMNSPSLEGVFPAMKKQAIEQMQIWVEPEVKKGEFRTDLSIKQLAFYLYTIGSSLIDYLIEFHDLDIKENVKQGKKVYGASNSKEKFMATVDANILFLKKAMNA